VETVDYSVIVNNDVVGPILLGRGMRYCHRTYLFFVLKVFPLSFGKLNDEETHTILPFALMLLLFLTFCLQMTVFYFSRQNNRKHK
jgi:hypothetical protein